MIKKTLLAMCMLSLVLVLGCQEEKKPASLVEDIKQKQAQELKNSIVATCEGCDTWMGLYVSPRDIVIARNPSVEQVLYLTVLDDEGNPVTCCEKPMRVHVDGNGKLYLHCPGCGKVKPIEVEGDKVIVVEANNQ